jgi:hypothetical protein
MNAGHADNLQMYRDAAEDLNGLLGLDPQIDIDADRKELSAKIKAAGILLEKGDQPTENTILALNKLNAIPKGWKLVKPKAQKPAKGIPTTTKGITSKMRRITVTLALVDALGWTRAVLLQELIDHEERLREKCKLPKDGYFYYQKRLLAKKLRMSEVAVWEALAGRKARKGKATKKSAGREGLRELGLIDWERRYQEWETGGKWQRYNKGEMNYYKLNHDAIRALLGAAE